MKIEKWYEFFMGTMVISTTKVKSAKLLTYKLIVKNFTTFKKHLKLYGYIK